MVLAAGDRLGQYVLAAPLGAGGMGEVYRAADTRLGRDVAIKVLPAEFAGDPERLARFEREARALASLNHPNVATLFGLEVEPVTTQAPSASTDRGPVTFLAMELVDGEDLSRRIARGAIPVPRALALAREIAAGLEAAHRAGVLHRDLKPGNIRIAADGTVKILDFGLAKLTAQTAGDPGDEPTVSSAMTEAGAILGTVPYLSPEQASGGSVDERTDIWAFGCVLFEMVTGRRPFEGASWTAVLAHILERDPDWSALPPSAGPALRRLLRRCLAKDPRHRFRDAGDIAILLDDLEPDSKPDASGEPRPETRPIARLAPWLAAAAGLVLAAFGWLGSPRDGDAVAPVLYFTETSPAPLNMARIGNCGVAVAVAPDGKTLAWIGATDRGTRLYLRRLDEAGAHAVPGTEGALSPFFSPDSRWLGFWADGALRKVAISGGAPQTICDFSRVHGVSWGDGVIVMGGTGDGSLWRVDPDGGTPRQIPTPNGSGYRASYPELLPGSRDLLATSQGNASVELVSLETGETRTLVKDGCNASYLEPGYLVWVRENTLVAAPFDLAQRTVTGEARTVLEGVLTATHVGITAHYAVSRNGTLVFLPGAANTGGSQLAWVALDGSPDALPLPEGPYLSPRVSPDGRRLLMSRPGRSTSSVWIAEPSRAVTAPFTGDEGSQFWAMWTSDGADVVFNSATPSAPFVNLWRQPADRSAPPVRLTHEQRHNVPVDMTRDGRAIVMVTAAGIEDDTDVELLRLDAGPETVPLLATDANEMHPTLSPDDRFMAYTSDLTGHPEVYVQPFPGPGATIRISPDGGQEPLWSAAGDRIYYRSPDGRRVLAVPVTASSPLQVGRAALLFEGGFVPGLRWGSEWDIHPDGRRFLMLKIPEEAALEGARVIVNWATELEQAFAAEP